MKNALVKSMLLAFGVAGVAGTQIARASCDCGSASPDAFKQYGINISQKNNAGMDFDYDPRSLRANGVESFKVRINSEVVLVDSKNFVKKDVVVTLNPLQGSQIKLCQELNGSTTRGSELELDYNRFVYSGDTNEDMSGPAVLGNKSWIEGTDKGNGQVTIEATANGIPVGPYPFTQTDPSYVNPDYPFLPVHGSVSVDDSFKPGRVRADSFPKFDF